MGFTEAQATAALKECQENVERAVDWLFSRADDLDAAVNGVLQNSEGCYSFVIALHSINHVNQFIEYIFACLGPYMQMARNRRRLSMGVVITSFWDSSAISVAIPHVDIMSAI